jgi:hypothetical protein
MRNRQFGRDRVVTYGFAQTDDEGKYEFMDLIPAEYFVSAAAKPWYAVYPAWVTENGVKSRVETVAPELNVAYATTFYNGATEADAASPIKIEKGARVAADIHLNAVPALHVTVKGTGNPADGTMYWPGLQKIEFDIAEPAGGEVVTTTESGGEMEISGLVPGSYFLGEPNGNGRIRTAGEIELTKDGQSVEPKGPAATATLRVKVKTAHGEDTPEGLNLSLRDERNKSIAFVPVTGGGASFEGVPPGKFALLVNVSKAPQYTVGRISQQGGAEVEGHDITVSEGSTVEVNATLMAGVVSIEGVVKKDGKPVSGVMVALVPKDPRTHIERFRRDQSNLDGSFMVGGILPGNYTLIAVEDGWGFAWMKEGVLEKYLARGQELTIGEWMERTVVLPEALEAEAK